jgi:mRNA-degrading endonuclease RelE of RelBE toxin-antitoxin system
MPYSILVTPEFEEDYALLPSSVVQRINSKVEAIAEHPEQIRFPLRNLPRVLRGLHKVRVGDYRILLWPDHQRRELTLYAVGHRNTIYKRLGKA